SLSYLNPLNNHLLIEIQAKESSQRFNAKAYFILSENLDLSFDVADIIQEDNDDKMQIKGMKIKISTPLHHHLLKAQKRLAYLISHASVTISVDEYESSYPMLESPEKLASTSVKNFLWKISGNTKTEGDT